MKTKTKYLCPICESEHNTEQDAKICEALGYPEFTKDIKVGDVITFSREETAGPASSMVTYIQEQGTVLKKIHSLNSKTNKHMDVLLCHVKARMAYKNVANEETGKEEEVLFEEFPVCERGVVEITLEGEGTKLLGPAEYAFKVGFTKALSEERITNKV